MAPVLAAHQRMQSCIDRWQYLRAHGRPHRLSPACPALQTCEVSKPRKPQPSVCLQAPCTHSPTEVCTCMCVCVRARSQRRWLRRHWACLRPLRRAPANSSWCWGSCWAGSGATRGRCCCRCGCCEGRQGVGPWGPSAVTGVATMMGQVGDAAAIGERGQVLWRCYCGWWHKGRGWCAWHGRMVCCQTVATGL